MSDQTELTPEQSAAHWKKTKGLMLTCLALWLIFGFAVHFFVDALNEIVIFGFPMGWYMGAQGSLIAFVIIVFWFSSAQNRIDTEFGVAEDEM
tara:strand:- start:371 stop:649 length:279 start_codon:yes stop_codon:yes gene_type:complete